MALRTSLELWIPNRTSQSFRLRGRTNARIVRPPGHRLLAVTDWMCSAKSQLEVFLPIVAEMRAEYNDALVARKVGKSRWVLVRGYSSFATAVVGRLPLSVVRLVIGLLRLS